LKRVICNVYKLCKSSLTWLTSCKG